MAQRYIQLKSPEGLETIDEFDTRKEARDALKEYQSLRSPGCRYYISTRPCKHWKEK